VVFLSPARAVANRAARPKRFVDVRKMHTLKVLPHLRCSRTAAAMASATGAASGRKSALAMFLPFAAGVLRVRSSLFHASI
jgi:hypothetical protein